MRKKLRKNTADVGDLIYFLRVKDDREYLKRNSEPSWVTTDSEVKNCCDL